MDFEHQLERALRAAERIRHAAALDFMSLPERPVVRASRDTCPGAVDRLHSAPNTSMRCTYCGQGLGRRARPAHFPLPPFDPMLDQIDPVTLEPVDPQERADAFDLGRRR